MAAPNPRGTARQVERVSFPEVPAGAPNEAELVRIRYQAQLDAELAEVADRRAAQVRQQEQDFEREKIETAADDALYTAVHDARLELAKGAIERSRSAAEFVRNAAAAVVTLYTGIVGLAFATGQHAEPLPARGVVPALFLGLAIVLSTAYVALLTRTAAAPPPEPHSSARVSAERRLDAFMDWVSGMTLDKAYALHASVIAVGAGAVTLPIAFVSLPTWFVVVVLAVGLGGTFLVPIWSARPRP